MSARVKRDWTKNKRWVLRFGVAVVAVMCQTGCGSASSSGQTADMASPAEAVELNGDGGIYVQGYAAVEEEVLDDMEALEEKGEASVASNRKLIKDVYMDVETGDFDALFSTVEKKVDALGGYIENMHVYNGSNRNGSSLKNANITIRIPKDKLDLFVTEVAEASNVVSRNEDTRDVTMQYVDLESHKKALQTEQGRLLELMERAETVEDIIAIEERLSQIRYEMESMESQLRTYDNLVDFSTVTLYIQEVEELTPTKEETAADRMAKGFAASVRNLMKGIKNTFIWLVICIPYFIFLAVIIAIVIAIIRTAKRRKAKKLQELGWQQEAKIKPENNETP